LFTIVTGFLAGSYPAFYLSSFNPVQVLKGNLKAGKRSSLPRKVLVVIQFASSVVLMIGTIVVNQQIQYGKNRPIGFNNKGLISVDWSDDIGKHFEALGRNSSVQVQPFRYVKVIHLLQNYKAITTDGNGREVSPLKNR